MMKTILPYAGTSGFSGSDTSEKRARTDDDSGITGARQLAAMEQLKIAGANGITWYEFAELIGCHHGSASSTLSILHGEGWIARLKESRRRSKVYVRPEFVNGRDVEKKRKKSVSVPDGCTALILPSEIVEKLAKSEDGSFIPLFPSVADQIRDAARKAVER
jgi:hypothetical protein